MFSNTHYYSMDKKGRVSLPAEFRESLKKMGDTQIVLTIYRSGDYRYLMAMPESAWEPASGTVEDAPFDQESRAFQRYVNARREICPQDRQGRILIPPRLRDYAGLTKEVALVGVGKSFELWDRQTFETHFDELDAAMAKKGSKSQSN